MVKWIPPRCSYARQSVGSSYARQSVGFLGHPPSGDGSYDEPPSGDGSYGELTVRSCSVRSACCSLCAVALMLLSGCAQEMMNQRRVESQEASVAYAGGAASRPIPDRAVLADVTALGSVSAWKVPAESSSFDADLAINKDGYRDGRSAGELVDTIPSPVLEHYDYRQLIQRGRERFNISCSPCHGRTGSGDGMVARRGFKYPPSYHTSRLRSKPLGYIFSVASNGRGEMPSYGDFISTDDRWAITSYVRTLQFSQYAEAKSLSEADRVKLDAEEQTLQRGEGR